MKKYDITIGGWGYEIAIGPITSEDEDKINSVMEENEIDDLGEFYSDWDLVEEAGVDEWHENEGKYQIFGASFYSSFVTVTDEKTNIEVLHKKTEDLICFKNVEGVDNTSSYEEEFVEADDEILVCAISEDKGTIFGGTIEIEGDFDESKLKLVSVELIIDGVGDYDIIGSVEYDGEEIDNDGLATSGKSFEAYFIK